MSHDVIEELLATEVLDGLDGDDRTELARLRAEHGDCPECRTIESGLRETAAALASSLGPVRPPAGGADAIVGRDRAVAPVAPMVRRARRPVWTAAIGVAAALVLVLGSVSLLGGRSEPATLAGWSQRVVRFEGDAGELAMAYVPGRPGVAFWGSNLPDPGAGRTFEIWMIDGDTPVPGGCVTPVDGNVAVYVDANVGTTDRMAVTVEPTTCPSTPTGAPVLQAQL